MMLVENHSSLRLTIVYETGDDGWIIASVPEVPGVHSHGMTGKTRSPHRSASSTPSM